MYSADLYMDIFSCASQYCQSKIMLKVTKNIRNCLKAKLKKLVLTAVLKVSNVFMLRIVEGNAFQR